MEPVILILIIILAVILFFAAILLLRALAFPRLIEPVEPVEGMPVDGGTVAKHLSAALRLQTVSSAIDAETPLKELLQLHRLLEKTYPRVHATLKREVINQGSLLYTWQGSNLELDPVLLAAHLDVVPVDGANGDQWEQPPFSGKIADGMVWGRGALDCKHQVIALLEAVENLLAVDFQPERTILLGFGHDEEVLGKNGAGMIVRHLADQGVRLEAVLDEGGSILAKILPGVETPAAMIGIGEKGYLTLELSVTCPVGHSSMPPKQTAIGILSAALTRLSANPMPAHLDMVLPTLRWLGPALPFSTQFALANTWLLGGMVKRRLAQKPTTDAAIRTTIAPTMISGGIKDNILPASASAKVNFRILPGDSIAGVCEHVRRAIADDRVQIQAVEDSAREPSLLSPIGSDAYLSLATTIQQIFGSLPVTPMLVLGGTDAYHYYPICENVYRFTPLLYSTDDLRRVHGVNERIAIEDLEKMVQFYALLMAAWGNS